MYKITEHPILSVPEQFTQLCEHLNLAVLSRAQELTVEHMGTTVCALCVGRTEVTVCNLGDSRVYLLRDGQLRQMSTDHVEHWEGRKKTPLTQHLGIDPMSMRLEPSIVQEPICEGDRWLLCSDGVSDMVEDPEILQILQDAECASDAVTALTDSAMAHGGRDNITAIVCIIGNRPSR